MRNSLRSERNRIRKLWRRRSGHGRAESQTDPDRDHADILGPDTRARTNGRLSTAAFTGLFTTIDLVSKKGHDFEPNELIVTLTKADGPPRVYTILVDADDLQNVKWIRVRRD